MLPPVWLGLRLLCTPAAAPMALAVVASTLRLVVAKRADLLTMGGMPELKLRRPGADEPVRIWRERQS